MSHDEMLDERQPTSTRSVPKPEDTVDQDAPDPEIEHPLLDVLRNRRPVGPYGEWVLANLDRLRPTG